MKLSLLTGPTLIWGSFFSQNWTPLQCQISVMIGSRVGNYILRRMTQQMDSYYTAKWVTVGNKWPFLRFSSGAHLWRQIAMSRSHDMFFEAIVWAIIPTQLSRPKRQKVNRNFEGWKIKPPTPLLKLRVRWPMLFCLECSCVTRLWQDNVGQYR